MGSETPFEKRDLKKSKEEPPPTYDSCQKPGPSHDPLAPTEEEFLDEIALPNQPAVGEIQPLNTNIDM